MTLPAAFAVLLASVLLASAWLWAFAVQRAWRGQPLLAFEPRPTTPWTMLDLLIALVCLIGCAALAAGLLEFVSPAPELVGAGKGELSASVTEPVSQETEPQPLAADSRRTRWQIVFMGAASLTGCLLAAAAIVLRTGADWKSDLGLTLRSVGHDLGLGLVAYVMLAPVIYAMQATIQHWYPSEHPLVESFRSNPTVGFYLICVFSAAIVAPLVEEFLCRVLLQGWLERVFTGLARESEAGFDGPFERPPAAAPPILTGPAPGAGTEIAAAAADGSEQGTAAAMEPAGEVGVLRGAPLAQELRGWFWVVPILISSFVFAALHLGNGLDPIPLFVLALGLGYLYQRTHRLLPCVVLHFLVNAFALAMLAASLFVDSP